jgi:hypothetical protein
MRIDIDQRRSLSGMINSLGIFPVLGARHGGASTLPLSSIEDVQTMGAGSGMD